MRCLAALLALVCLAEARPQHLDFKPSICIYPYILGGTEASPGEFPWQLSQQRGGGGSWGHSCGASLLTSNSALSAAHCVDGATPDSIRIVAGLHSRSNENGAQASIANGYVMHADYNTGGWTFPNDIAIIYHNAFGLGGNTALLTLPPDNNNQFVGVTCTLSGWGRTSASNDLPDNLQKVDIPVISTAECNSRVSGIGSCHDSQIAVYSSSNAQGSCNGDSGGPMNCPLGGSVVAGVTSWGISGGGACLPSYPSVYTRTGYYLQWIRDNTP